MPDNIFDMRKCQTRKLTLVTTGIKACEIASFRLRDLVDENKKVRVQTCLNSDMIKDAERRRVIVSKRLEKELRRYVETECGNYRPSMSFILRNGKWCEISKCFIGGWNLTSPRENLLNRCLPGLPISL